MQQMARAAAAAMKKRGLLSQMEREVEEAKQRFGEELMAKKLQNLPEEEEKPRPCPRCGKEARFRRKVARTFTSMSGPHTLWRNFHYCEFCKKGFYPRDEELELPKRGKVSAEVEKLMADFALNDPYGFVEERWAEHYPHIPASANQFRQVMKRLGREAMEADAVLLQLTLQEPAAAECTTLYVSNDGGMVPMRKEAAEAVTASAEAADTSTVEVEIDERRAAKSLGNWKEAKLGMTFRVENLRSSRESNRGIITRARFAAELGEQKDFKPQMKALLEAELAGGAVKAVVWLGDGLAANWTLAGDICPSATQILDFQHALQHAMDFEKAMLGENHPQLPHKKAEWESRLLTSNVEATIASLMDRLEDADTPEKLKATNDLVRYYRNNAQRMKYSEYLARGLLIGSGPIEAAHRHVIQARMKRSGQHWGTRGGRQMARLRAAYRTAGPGRSVQAIHWAYRETQRLPVAPPKRRRRYASNR